MSYRTVYESAVEMQEISRSKFIVNVKPVDTRSEAEAFLKEIKLEHKAATHNVGAFIIGEKSELKWASDDGEPQGTAAGPMLKYLEGENLTNLCVVVTRYFGGIKLGTGGLARAYSSTCKLGVEKAKICEVRPMLVLKTSMDYSTYNRLLSKNLNVSDVSFMQDVTLNITILPEMEEDVLDMLNDLSNGKCIILEREIVNVKVIV